MDQDGGKSIESNIHNIGDDFNVLHTNKVVQHNVHSDILQTKNVSHDIYVNDLNCSITQTSPPKNIPTTKFLSVMVFIPQIQTDKVRTGNNGSRIQAQALLDTGSLVGDFISQNLCLSLNALHLCYTSLIPLVVCSGLDGTCYSNNTVIDIGINNVCHTIYLTVRVKQ